jgi:hypothetical protein
MDKVPDALNLLTALPSPVAAVIREFRACEFSTLTKDGTPITWPVATLYLPDQARFLLTTSIGFSQKALHIRRNPHVALLFSDPTGSGLENPPAVLIQGDAVVSDEVVTSVDGVAREYWRDTIFRRQPATEFISGNFLTRKFMDWYYMRLLIFVTPRALYWWPEGDFSQPRQKFEVGHVA